MLYIKKAEATLNECFSMVGSLEKAKLLAIEFITQKIESTPQVYLKDFWGLVLNYLKSK